ncbi:MAG: LysR family transcriptional regulator [Pseudomonadota bacterium]
MLPKPDALRAFIAVAECGTLASAAERLNRTPSAVSTTMKQLEATFGGPLFDGERKSQLTALGRFALERARVAVADFDSAMLAVCHYAAGRIGRVRVAAVPSIATHLLPDVVAAFQQAAPDVALEIRDVDSRAVSELVRDNEADIGLASRAPVSSTTQARTLLTEPFLVVCASDHWLVKAGQPVQWAALARERFIAHGLLGLIGRTEVDALVAEPAVTVHNVASMISFVERGLGVTLLPALAVPESASVATLPLADNAVTRTVHLLTEGELNPAATTFADLVVAQAGVLSARLASGGFSRAARQTAPV